MVTRVAQAVSTILAALLLTSCGGGITVGPPPPGQSPDFSIAINPGTVNAAPGGTSNGASVGITGLNNFSGAVVINIAGLPAGATTSPPLPFAVNAGASQMVTVAVPAGAATGNVALTVTGTNGQLNHSAALVLSVTTPPPPPDFSLAVNPGTVSAAPGATTNAATVAITGINGFSSAVSVSIAGLPAGATTTPAQPFSVNAGASQMVTVAVPAGAATGNVALTVTGTNGQLNHSAALVLSVTTAPPPPDFSLAVNPASVSAAPGATTNAATVAITGINGFSSAVSVSIAGLPAGATTTPAQPLSVNAGASQMVTVAVPAGAATGNVALTVTGTSGQLVHSAALVLSVTTPPPPPDFSLAVNPGTVSAAPGATTNAATVSITALNGFASQVSVSITGLPQGVTTTPPLPFSVSAGGSQQVTFTLPLNAAPGSVGLTLTGASGQLTHTTPLILTVNGPAPGTDQIVVVGNTSSTDFPTTPGALRPNDMGGEDGFVTSVQLAGAVATRTFSTYFGGNGGEQVRDIFIDGQGNIYITGQTISTDMPTTPGVLQRNCNATCANSIGDGFVAVFNPSGQLLRSTYFGGSGGDEGYNIFVDATGIYVGGRTGSVDYPVTGPSIAQRTFGGGNFDFHVTKFPLDLSSIIWATYLGGLGEDTGRGRLGVDNAGNVYISGETRSNNFPGAAGQLTGGRDGVAVKLSPDGALLYTRIVGGNETAAEGLTGGLGVKGNGEVYACGLTTATDIPNSIRPFGGGSSDSFLVHLAPDGQIMEITYYGGNGFDECEGLGLDSAGNVILATLTSSTAGLPITVGAFQATAQGGNDYNVAKFSPNLSQIIFSTYIGGSANEAADTVRLEVDASDNIIFAGHTTTTALPWITPNAVQPTFAGGSHDLLFVVLSADGRQILYATYFGGTGTDSARSVRYRRNP